MRAILRCLVSSLVAVAILAGPTAAAQSGPTVPPADGPAADTQVVGGQDADPGEDPWMAALVIHERYEPNPFAGLGCGGAFISPDTVVTAAHCVEGLPPDFIQIVAGSNDLVPDEVERLDIRNIRVHPDRDRRTGRFDIAVVQLRRPPTVPVTPIDLVTPADAALWEVGDLVRFTGWGEDEQRQPISRLQEGEAPVVADGLCRSRYTGAIFAGTTMVCVGDLATGATSPCYGDSGGPLTVLDGSRPVLIGVVLGGFRCGDPNYPAIFTQVSAATGFLEPYLDPDSAPDAVTDLRGQRRGPQGRAIVASWRPPAFDGGSRITRQDVTVDWQRGSTAVSQGFTIGGGARSVRIPRVPGDVPVRITVTPVNAIGSGPTASTTVAP